MENNDNPDLFTYINIHMEQLDNAVMNNLKLLQEVEANKNYLCQLLIDQYAKEIGISQIENDENHGM